MAITLDNPIAYGKRYMAQNVDSLTRVAVCASGTTVYNGTLVTLDGMNTGNSANMGYVFNATPVSQTNGNTNDVWMVRAPEVPKDVCGNLYDDPRAFEVAGGVPFDIIRLMPNDIIHVSDTAFGDNTKPDASTNVWVYSDQNGEFQAASTASGITGLVLKYVSSEPIVVGQEMVSGFVLQVIQNPTMTLA